MVEISTLKLEVRRPTPHSWGFEALQLLRVIPIMHTSYPKSSIHLPLYTQTSHAFMLNINHP